MCWQDVQIEAAKTAKRFVVAAPVGAFVQLCDGNPRRTELTIATQNSDSFMFAFSFDGSTPLTGIFVNNQSGPYTLDRNKFGDALRQAVFVQGSAAGTVVEAWETQLNADKPSQLPA